LTIQTRLRKSASLSSRTGGSSFVFMAEESKWRRATRMGENASAIHNSKHNVSRLIFLAVSEGGWSRHRRAVRHRFALRGQPVRKRGHGAGFSKFPPTSVNAIAAREISGNRAADTREFKLREAVDRQGADGRGRMKPALCIPRDPRRHDSRCMVNKRPTLFPLPDS
jgi:hypothetical protein